MGIDLVRIDSVVVDFMRIYLVGRYHTCTALIERIVQTGSRPALISDMCLITRKYGITGVTVTCDYNNICLVSHRARFTRRYSLDEPHGGRRFCSKCACAATSAMGMCCLRNLYPLLYCTMIELLKFNKTCEVYSLALYILLVT